MAKEKEKVVNVPVGEGEEKRELSFMVKKPNNFVQNKANALFTKWLHEFIRDGIMTKKELENFKNKIEIHPENFIAQPILELSTVPIFSKNKLSQRHVDLRPFSLIGNKKFKLVSGALTRVALKKNSLIVNSSQGGGVKDTWILSE